MSASDELGPQQVVSVEEFQANADLLLDWMGDKPSPSPCLAQAAIGIRDGEKVEAVAIPWVDMQAHCQRLGVSFEQLMQSLGHADPASRVSFEQLMQRLGHADPASP